jgi:hypothetical protein
MPQSAGMRVGRAGVAVALVAAAAYGLLVSSALRDDAPPISPSRGGSAAVAAARPHAGCRVAVPVIARNGAGLFMVATNVTIDPRTGAVLSCKPVLGNGTLAFDLRYVQGTTTHPMIVTDPSYPFGRPPD